jgi:hypothetical protein
MRVGRLTVPHARRSSRLGAGRRATAVILAVGSCGVLSAVTSGPAWAAPPTTYYAAPATVGAGDCTTAANACRIETAIGKTSNGDTVELAEGTYTGAGDSALALTIATSITLRAPGAKAVLDGTGNAPAVLIGTGPGADVIIDGLTLQNASDFAISTASAGSITVRNSTLANNSAGIAANTTATIDNSTVTGSADVGVMALNTATLTVTTSTITDNWSSGIVVGAAFGGGTLRIGASVVAGNGGLPGGRDCGIQGVVVDEGFNIDSDGTCGFTAATGSVSGSSTITSSLAPVADNGGQTPTRALLAGSPAIGLVTGAPTGGAVCGTADQRGVLRPGPPCDAGAFQTQRVTPATPTFTDDVCQGGLPLGSVYTISTTTGVDYFVNGATTPATAGDHTVPDGSTITITAQPRTGYVLTGTTSWSHTFPVIGRCPQPQTITFTSTPPATPTVGGTYTVTAMGGGSGNPVVFSTGSPTVCTVSGTGLVTFQTVGSCVVHADQSGGNGYLRAPTAAQTITVDKATQAITFASTPPTAPIVGDTYTVAATGGGSGQPVTFSTGSATICTVTGTTVTFIAAGSCVIDADQDGDANYTPAPQATQTVPVAAAPTPPTTSPPPSTAPPTQPSPEPSGSGLASTGTPTAALTLFAVLLMAGGGLVLLLGRAGRR